MDMNFENFDVNLDDIKVVADTPAQETATNEVPQQESAKQPEQPKQEVATRPQSSAPAKVEFKFDFNKLNLPGIIVDDIGLEVSRYPVDKMKFKNDKRELISIITPQVMAVKCHYIEGLGSVLCNGKACCKVAGAPRVKYLFPIVVYETDAKGRPISAKLSYKVLAVGNDVYKEIMTIADLQDITSIDLVVTCKEETYQDLSLQPAGNCRWQTKPAMVQEVVDFWNEHMEDIVKPIAREVDESELLGSPSVDMGISTDTADYDSFFN